MRKRLLALLTSSAFIASLFVNPISANAVGGTELVLKVNLGLPQAGDILQLHFEGPTENLSIDWGDGTPISYDSNSGTFNYGTSDTSIKTVTVTSSSQASRFTFGKGDFGTTGANLITSVVDFPVWIDKYSGSFRNAINLTAVPNALPVETVGGVAQSVVTSTSRMFEGAYNFNGDISSWDTSRVTDMSHMFSRARSFTTDIGSWDTSSVTDMSYMFSDAADFNANISTWVTSAVTNMQGMFSNATSFNSDIDHDDASGYWDVSSVTNMNRMFGFTNTFNQDISSWNVSSVTDMSGMFEEAVSFNQDLTSWDVSSVTVMDDMFESADVFNGAIGSWDVSSVQNMKDMFYGADAFNQNIDVWDVSSVTNMNRMFGFTNTFNQDISSWNVSSVTDMSEMFEEALSFNQDLTSWDVSSVTNMEEMFQDAPVFDGALGTWDVSSVSNMKEMFEGATAFNGNISDWDTSAVKTFKEMFRDAASFNVFIGGWAIASDASTSRMFRDSGFTYCLPAEFFASGVVDYTQVGLAADFGDSCVVFVAPAPATVFRPYYGPISRPMARTEVIADEEATVRGFRLDVVEKVTVGNQELELVSQDSSELVVVIANDVSGMVSLNLHWRNGDRTGVYRIPEAFNVLPAETSTEPVQAIESDTKVSAGSFKGYVAVYAKGYEGQRLSAKIGNDWVIVPSLASSFERIVDFTGAGVNISVRIYIDRVLTATIPLVTK